MTILVLCVSIHVPLLVHYVTIVTRQSIDTRRRLACSWFDQSWLDQSVPRSIFVTIESLPCQSMLQSIISMALTIFGCFPALSIAAMPPPGARRWRGKSIPKERRRRQLSRSKSEESQSGSESRRQSEELNAHATSSGEGIDNAEDLSDRVALNNDIMRQCKDTFDTLQARNIKLLEKLEARRASLVIPSWSTSGQSASGGVGHSCGHFGPRTRQTICRHCGQ